MKRYSGCAAGKVRSPGSRITQFSAGGGSAAADGEDLPVLGTSVVYMSVNALS